jgi:hypothetical protein
MVSPSSAQAKQRPENLFGLEALLAEPANVEHSSGVEERRIWQECLHYLV